MVTPCKVSRWQKMRAAMKVKVSLHGAQRFCVGVGVSTTWVLLIRYSLTDAASYRRVWWRCVYQLYCNTYTVKVSMSRKRPDRDTQDAEIRHYKGLLLLLKRWDAFYTYICTPFTACTCKPYSREYVYNASPVLSGIQYLQLMSQYFTGKQENVILQSELLLLL